MNTEKLLDSPLFRGITARGIESILSETPHRVKRFRAGDMIAQSGDRVSRLLIVINGDVKGEMVDYTGRVIRIEVIPSGGALASAFLFGAANRFPVNVIAVSDTDLLIINKDDFIALMMRMEDVLLNFLDIVSNRSQFLSEKIRFLNIKTIKGKLAHLLIFKAGKNNEIRLDMTQNDIADYFGVARPSVARSLGEMENEGLIETNRKSIKIINRNGLCRLIRD